MDVMICMKSVSLNVVKSIAVLKF